MTYNVFSGTLNPTQSVNQESLMKRDVEVGLSPGHSVLGGDPAPHPKSCTAPNFQPMSVVAKRLDGLGCHLVWR